jgi:hypothetical protein
MNPMRTGTPMPISRSRRTIAVRYRDSGSSAPVTGTNTGRVRYATSRLTANVPPTSRPTRRNSTILVTTMVENTDR